MTPRTVGDGEGHERSGSAVDVPALLPVEVIVAHVVRGGHRSVRLTPARITLRCGDCEQTIARVADEVAAATPGARYWFTGEGLCACPGFDSQRAG